MPSCGNKMFLVAEQAQGSPHDALHHSGMNGTLDSHNERLENLNSIS